VSHKKCANLACFNFHGFWWFFSQLEAKVDRFLRHTVLSLGYHSLTTAMRSAVSIWYRRMTHWRTDIGIYR